MSAEGRSTGGDASLDATPALAASRDGASDDDTPGASKPPGWWIRGYTWAVSGASLGALTAPVVIVTLQWALNGGRNPFFPLDFLVTVTLVAVACWWLAFFTAWPMFIFARISAAALRMRSIWHELAWGALTGLFLLPIAVTVAGGGLRSLDWPLWIETAPYFAFSGCCGAALSWWKTLRRTGESSR